MRELISMHVRTNTKLIGPEPVMGLSVQTVRTLLCDWSLCEQQRLWLAKDGCRQVKQFISGPSLGLAKLIVGLQLKRKEIRLLVGLLTGHVALRRHLFLLNKEEDPMCPHCGEAEETAMHFLGNCSAFTAT
jgi:hypothetical protein